MVSEKLQKAMAKKQEAEELLAIAIKDKNHKAEMVEEISMAMEAGQIPKNKTMDVSMQRAKLEEEVTILTTYQK